MTQTTDYPERPPVPTPSQVLASGSERHAGAASFLPETVRDTVQTAGLPYETQGSCLSFRGHGSTPLSPSVAGQPTPEGRAESVRDSDHADYDIRDPLIAVLCDVQRGRIGILTALARVKEITSKEEAR